MDGLRARGHVAVIFHGWKRNARTRRDGRAAQHDANVVPEPPADARAGAEMPSMQMLFALADLFRVDAADLVREVELQRHGRRADRAAAMLSRAGLTATTPPAEDAGGEGPKPAGRRAGFSPPRDGLKPVATSVQTETSSYASPSRTKPGCSQNQYSPRFS